MQLFYSVLPYIPAMHPLDLQPTHLLLVRDGMLAYVPPPAQIISKTSIPSLCRAFLVFCCCFMQLFHLPIMDAVAQGGISVSHLKKTSRLLGIKAWPYRKLHSMKALRQAMVENGSATEEEKLVRASIVHAGALDGWVTGC